MSTTYAPNIESMPPAVSSVDDQSPNVINRQVIDLQQGEGRGRERHSFLGCSRTREARASDLSDIELIDKFQAGRAAPVYEAELFRRIRRYALPELSSARVPFADQEDLLQIILTKTWRNIGRYNPKLSTLRTWVSRIARYTVIDESRRASCRPRIAPIAGRPDEGSQTLWETDASYLTQPGLGDDAIVVLVELEAYCHGRPNSAEGFAVWSVLAEGFRIADIKALFPSIAGSIDRWVKNARRTLSAALAVEAV